MMRLRTKARRKNDMKKILSALLTLLVVSSLCVSAMAEDSSRYYDFIMTCDGESVVSREKDETVAVTLSLRCVDIDEDTTVSAFQTEICYDDNVLELVQNSMKLAEGVNAVDIQTDSYGRRIRVSYVIEGETAAFKKDTEVMSFEFRVLDEIGRTEVTQENFLVCTEDGSNVYSCDAEELDIDTEAYIIPQYSVVFETMNGEAGDEVLITQGSTVGEPETIPTREGFTFAGWYEDSACEQVYDFSSPVESSFTLYAKWDKIEPETKPWVIYAIAVPLIVGLAAFLIIRRKNK